ncbi:hypothetical protein SDRG_02873 [Saprolegnia diclina VS20]|uniref:Uncharacterized protein n=1 Tax=Saprolegnia diclina (strain VS20) TaxID=1156394 RepID=T0R1L2_SAPDV|nr:hypothetical protein SDRG_02873 [Saprolegnia diclina VS20]EQC40225.1 hypothetical protein SDRG_02873 [Saprolegnia diclina VS20]|eukprot:XP_008606699.1 hypothetical protein SDRG_02873 [Saprolegnia diclina VS20]
MDGRPDNIRTLILEKEKELHDINEYRIRTLETMLKEKEAAMGSYKQKFHKLQEDFKYNLKLLEGRDEELAMYDSNFATMKIVLRDRENEIGELQIQLADVASDMKAEKQKHAEQDAFYTQKLKDVRAQVEAARWSYDDAMRKQKDEFDAYKRRNERELREKDEDMESLRREMSVTFDELLRAREAEAKATTDDITTKLRETELKAKSLAREVETTKERNTELRRKVDDLLSQVHESDTQAKALQWELSDVRGLKDAKIAELEADKVDLQQVKQALLDEYEGKMAELLQSLHAVEKAFLQQKAQFEDEVRRVTQRKDNEMKEHGVKFEARIEALIGKLRSVEETLEKVQTELKQSKWEADDQLLQREREMERLVSDHKDALEQRETMLKELKNELWTAQVELKSSKDASRQSLQLVTDAKEKELHAKQQITQLHEQIEDLQRRATSHDASNESKLRDLEQEWQAKFDIKYRELAALKDRLQAEKMAVEDRYRHAENELVRLRGDLFAQKAALQMNEAFKLPSSSVKTVSEPALSPSWTDPPPSIGSLPPVSPPPSVVAATPTKPVDSLEAENARLKSVIRAMTEEVIKQTAAVSPDSEATDLARQLSQAVADADRLQARVHELEQAGSATLQAQLLHVQQELLVAQQTLDAKNQLIERLQKENAMLQAARPSTESNATAQQLTQALQDIQVLRHERNQLMELSNQLTADLRKQQLQSPVDTTARIADLTQSLEEYRLHNKALKKELRKWLKKGEFTLSAAPVEPPPARRRSDPIDDDDEYDDEAPPDEAGDVSTPLPTRRPSNLASTLFQQAPRPEANSSLSDARLKLKHAKEVLALAGKKVDEPQKARAASMVVSSSQKETPSQRSAMHKLKELQSKRAEMAEERKKVRNYSVPGT